MGAIVVIGGYGNAGRPIVQLLLRHTDRDVVVGSHSDRAESFARALNDPRVTSAAADATEARTLPPARHPDGLRQERRPESTR